MVATFDEVVKLAEQLDTNQQNLLIYRLRVKQMQEHMSKENAQSGIEGIESYHSPSREELIHDAEILRNTPVRSGDSLFGKYANPHVPELSEEEFHAQMHAIATEWEQELDDLFSDNS